MLKRFREAYRSSESRLVQTRAVLIDPLDISIARENWLEGGVYVEVIMKNGKALFLDTHLEEIESARREAEA